MCELKGFIIIIIIIYPGCIVTRVKKKIKVKIDRLERLEVRIGLSSKTVVQQNGIEALDG